MEWIFITNKDDFDVCFMRTAEFPQDLYNVLIEQIELAELRGYNWIVKESNETKPISIIFDSFDDKDENINHYIYMYSDFM